MKKNQLKQSAGLRTHRIIYPIVIGLGVVAYLFWDEFDPKAFSLISFTWKSVLWLIVAALLMVGRDFGYIMRIRVLSDNQLTWRSAFRIIMLWEFTSAVTPGAVGGTSVAIVYVNKEGVSVGKSSAIVMATSLLDELYFVLMFPLLLLTLGYFRLFDFEGGKLLTSVAAIGYSVKLTWTVALFYGMFSNPKGLSWLIGQVFRLPILRRWKEAADRAGDEIIASSRELKRKPIGFWLRAFGCTFLSWTSRYWVVNALFLAFFTVDGFINHLVIFGRQLVMWIMLLVMPTPGGSGFAEKIFQEALTSFIPIAGFTAFVVLLWRFITYYPYLFIGAVLLPKWFSTQARKKKE